MSDNTEFFMTDLFQFVHSKRSRLGSVGKGDQRQNKGLRHFSWKVCEKVRQKQSTTYNEVADELVKELSETGELDKGKDAVSKAWCKKGCPSFSYSW